MHTHHFRHRVSHACQRPADLTFAIVPKPGNPFGPLGRCGHTIFSEHRLVIRGPNGNIVVVDTVAKGERRRDMYGVRDPGFLGRHTGFSLSRCDGCVRADRLSRSIVCPCCRDLVVPGNKVSLISQVDVRRQNLHPDLLPFMVTTEPDGLVVLCTDCGERYFDDQDENILWNGTGVSLLHEYPSA